MTDNEFLIYIAILVPGVFLSIVVLYVCTSGVRKLRSHANIDRPLKWLFYLAAALAATFVISWLICRLLVLWSRPAIAGVFVWLFIFTYLSLLVCLLATLVARLMLTFKDSVWQISNTVRNIFLAAFAAEVLLGSGLSFVYVFLFVDTVADIDVNPGTLLNILNITWFCLILFFATYIISAISAVCLFCRSLVALAKMTQSSVNAVAPATTINANQQRLVGLSAKYLLLFVVAICFTLITACWWPAHPAIVNLALPVDMSVNITCLYLQFSFANEQYQQCCGACDVCFTKCIQARLIDKQRQKDAVEVPSNPPSPPSSDGNAAI